MLGGPGKLGGARRALAPLVAFLTLLILLASPFGAAAQGSAGKSDVQQRNDWSPPNTVFIPETGHFIDGVFLDFWRGNNGINNYGYPITAEFELNGRTVQYYQYARFEYVPDDPNGNVVHLGEIGQDLRPHSVIRTSAASTVTNAKSSLSLEAAMMSRAWLPLDKKTAAKPNTDTWRYIEETKHSVSNGFKEMWEATGEDSYLGNPLSQEYILGGVTYQVFERGQLAWTSEKGVWVVALGEQLAKKMKIDTSPETQGDIPTYSEDLWVPPQPVGEHWIEVNLSTQYLIAWVGDTSVAETYVSTGRPGFDTPTGTFYINTKLETDDMEGVLGGEYYNVPAVPWVMYFTDVGHAIHGTYWHSNFGYVMSHGCVNLPMDFAEWLYYWADIGTRVEIHY
jgi:lipoprotein-anchoring transpeptidase ErfK/SrfK